MRRSTALVASLCLAATITAIGAASASHVPKTNTHAAIKAYVLDAASLVQKNGPSCAAFSSAAWRAGDYYIFVADPAGNAICHPTASLVGKPLSTITNAKGDPVGQKLIKMGMTTGGGWVDYLWPRPGQKVEEPKSTFVVGVKAADGKHYVVGGGAWNVNK